MRIKAKSVVGWSMVSVLWIASVAAAADLRLVEAAKSRDREAMRALLAEKLDVNTPQPDGATALHWAAHWDDLEMVDLLIRAGAQVNAANDLGATPLYLACENGNAAMVETLLKAGANPDAALSTGETALMTAARTGTLSAVNALLARGANVNAVESWRGQTALMWAVSEKHLEVARTLIEHGADIHARTTRTGFTPLLFAAREGDLDAIRMLLAAGADVNETAADGHSVLLVATFRGHVAVADFLMDRGADPNADDAGYTPLHWAVGKWETEITDDEFGIVVPPSGEWSALSGPRGQAKMDLIKALLAHGANPNARLTQRPPRGGPGGNLAGATPFFLAAAAADLTVMRLLLANGADPSLMRNDNVTPLMVAAGLRRNGDASTVKPTSALEAVKLLLELGADVNETNNAGETALHGTAYNGWDIVAEFLLDNGAAVNPLDKNGWTPLAIAQGVVPGEIHVYPSTAELLRKRGGVGVERQRLDLKPTPGQ